MTSTQTQKRSVEDESAPRPARKRARKACVECHNRKIRCDLYLRGSPCTNCKEDGQSCVIHIRKGKRSKATNESQGPLHQTPSTNNGQVPNQSFIGQLQSSNPPNAPVIAPDPTNNVSNQSIMSSYALSGNVPNHFQGNNVNELSMPPMQEMSASEPNMAPNTLPLLDADFSQFIDLDDIFRSHPNGMSSPYKESWNYVLPGNDMVSDTIHSPFIRVGTSPSSASQQSPLVETMDWTSSDKAYLKSQNCFTLPTSGALYKLMTVYFQNVHPNLPLINEGDFWDLWPAMSDGGFYIGTFSLFVLQSMCFAASSTAPEEYVQDCGFANGAIARENFHRRAKLLFDFGYERNPLHLSQGALLLSYHVRNMDRLRKNSQWLANAVLYARVSHGDRGSLQIEDIEKRDRMLKRLWWCAILRDRILPLGLRRPLQIPRFETQSPCLTETDFDDELGRSKVHNLATQKTIFRMICTMCKLAAALTPALIIMFSAEKPQDRLMKTPSELTKVLNDVKDNINQLHEWQDYAKEKFPSPIGLGDTNNTVTIFANLMFIYYNAAIIGLCHHRMLLWETKASSAGKESHPNPIVEIEQAIDDTTERVRELVQLGLVRRAPLSLTAYLTFPLLLHAISAKASSGSSFEGTAGRQLEIYARAMRFQRSIYDAADFAYGTVERIMSYADECQMTQHSTSGYQSDSVSYQPTSTGSLGKITGFLTWKELLQTKPRMYLRLAIHLDLAFCTGIPPEEEDFPPQLRRIRANGRTV